MRIGEPRLRSRLFAMLVASAIAPVLARVWLVVESESGASVADLGGALSDLGVSALLGPLLLAVARLGQLPALVVLAAWGGLHVAHVEHVRELGAGLSFSYAHYLADPAFLWGSAWAALSFAAFLGFLALPLGIAGWALPERTPLGRMLACAVSGAALCVGASLASAGPDAGSWRALHFAQQNARTWGSATEPKAAEGAPGRSALPAYRADLSGEPWLPLPRPGQNVLLVVLEGVPGGYVEPIAAAHGVTPHFTLPALGALARDGVVATSFITHQRQTNRGLYALLCGDYPRLDAGLAKMTASLEGPPPRCLPRVLEEHGYASAFLQAAPLAFMFKDAFMERAGFQQVLGDRHFEAPDVRTSWGVDDGSLFRRAAKLVGELDAGDAPWFVTLLTVGTHHPMILPPGRSGRDKRERTRIAFEFLDESLGAFVRDLEGRGILDDTLLLVTVDESRGLVFPGGDLGRALSENWGLLVARLPGGETREIEAPVAQSDLALSVLDYLGIPSDSEPFVGRSLWREPDPGRRVYFANTFRRWMFDAGAAVGPRRFVLCHGEDCDGYDVPGPGLFAGHPTRGPATEQEARDVRAAWAASRGEGTAAPGRLSLDFTPAAPVEISGVAKQRVLDGQNLHAPPGSRLEIEIALTVLGDGSELVLHHTLDGVSEGLDGAAGRGFSLDLELPALAPDDRLTLRYAAGSELGLERVKCRLRVTTSRGAGLAVAFEAARIRVVPLTEADRATLTASHTTGVGLLDSPAIEVETPD